VYWRGLPFTELTICVNRQKVVGAAIVTMLLSAAPTTGQILFSCSFPSTTTSSYCGMAHTGLWTLKVGHTGSSATGPSGGQSGIGGYAYVTH
jgi:hypothetical protein